MPSAFQRRPLLRVILLLGTGTILLVLAIFWFASACTRPGNDDRTPADPRLSYVGPFTNVHPSVEYVGDAKCAACHVEIAGTYARHPMGRSTVPIRVQAAKMPYDREHHNPFDAKGVRLTVQREGERIWHHVAQIDDGQTLWENRHEVYYVIGSGTRGYSYLTEVDGYLFQSAISWFSQKNIWDLSPGFPRVPSPGLPVSAGCLQCHANRAKEKPGYLMRYETGVFDGYNVGCERCHGPGQKHVAFHESGEILRNGYDKSIVNPVHLPWQLRENVCEQCHLGGERRVLRRGRGWFDYRPGMPLADFLAIYVKNPDLSGATKAVSQVEQMRKSQCFTKSPEDKKLGCTSCHDPHRHVEPKDTVSHYRQRCLVCHQKQGCSLPLAQRVKKVADDSCIACHMPRGATTISHTALTDHTISRLPTVKPPGANDPRADEYSVVHFHRDQVSGEDQEHRRDYAVALIRLIANSTMPKALHDRARRQALGILEGALARAPTDPAGWHAKGMGLAWEKRSKEAREAYSRALALEPLNEEVLDYLALLEGSMGLTGEATGHMKRLVEVNPYNVVYLRSLARQLARDGDWAGAGVQARAWIKLEPGNSAARQLWILSLLRRGRHEEASLEIEELRKLKPPNLAELEQSFRKRGG